MRGTTHPELRSMSETGISTEVNGFTFYSGQGGRKGVYTYGRERKWYGGDKVKVRSEDGRSADDHKHKPITHHLGGKEKKKRYYLVNSDDEVGKGGGGGREGDERSS